jgi:hypothetical protein
MKHEGVVLPIQGKEEGHALNVVPMEMSQKHVGMDRLIPEFAQQTFPEGPEAAAAVEDDQRAIVKPHLQACRIPAVARISVFGSRCGAPDTPKFDFHIVQPPGGESPKELRSDDLRSRKRNPDWTQTGCIFFTVM